MKQREVTKLLSGFKQAFSVAMITTLGRKSGFLKRERNMTPITMVMSLVSCFAGGLDSVNQHDRLNDNHLGRLGRDDCRWLVGQGCSSG